MPPSRLTIYIGTDQPIPEAPLESLAQTDEVVSDAESNLLDYKELEFFNSVPFQPDDNERGMPLLSHVWKPGTYGGTAQAT